MTIEAALAWANEPLVVIDDHDLAHDLVEARFNAGILAAEVRRLHAMRCETCAHQSKGDGLKVCWHSPIKCTGPYKSIDLTHYPKCETFGFTCGAWDAKDQT